MILASHPHVTKCKSSSFWEILTTTYCRLTPNMTRGDRKLKALVKRVAKVKTDHATHCVPEVFMSRS